MGWKRDARHQGREDARDWLSMHVPVPLVEAERQLAKIRAAEAARKRPPSARRVQSYLASVKREQEKRDRFLALLGHVADKNAVARHDAKFEELLLEIREAYKRQARRDLAEKRGKKLAETYLRRHLNDNALSHVMYLAAKP